MIEKTKNEVERIYGANVIYGDTDSVMVKFDLKEGGDRENQIRESMKYGK